MIKVGTSGMDGMNGDPSLARKIFFKKDVRERDNLADDSTINYRQDAFFSGKTHVKIKVPTLQN